MKKLVLLACLSLLPAYLAAQVPRSRHVWVIAEENHSFEDATASMPYLMSVAQQYGMAKQYYADMHNSISALMHLTAGQTVTTNDSTPDTFNVDNIARQLVRKRLSFRSYQQGLPRAGFVGLWAGKYVKRHNPLAYFTDVADTALRYNLVPMRQLDSDLATHQTGNYNYVTPDLDNDAHDGSLQAADEWLRQHLPAILSQPEFQPGGDGLLFVVFDEGNLGSDIDFRCNATQKDKSCGGRVLTVVVGPNVKPGFQSDTFYNHESLLATVCHALGTESCPGAAQSAAPMADFFMAPASASPDSVTVGAGEAAQYAIQVQPVSGFYNANVSFSCSHLPTGATCSFSPSEVRAGSSGGSTALTISAPVNSAGLLRRGRRGLTYELALWLGLPGVVLLPAKRLRRKRWMVPGIIAVVIAVALCAGCGGSPSGSSPALGIAQAQSYHISVTAHSGSDSFTFPVTLNVSN